MLKFLLLGGAYAINRKYFFELGGYDMGMYLYNGENYELSLKLHLCGGNLMAIPCSRVGEKSFLFGVVISFRFYVLCSAR
jgi:hypothetical protein